MVGFHMDDPVRPHKYVRQMMPVKISKLANNRYRVKTPNMTHAKSTTKEKAEAQARLLNAIDHGFVPDRKKRKKR